MTACSKLDDLEKKRTFRVLVRLCGKGKWPAFQAQAEGERRQCGECISRRFMLHPPVGSSVESWDEATAPSKAASDIPSIVIGFHQLNARAVRVLHVQLPLAVDAGLDLHRLRRNPIVAAR